MGQSPVLAMLTRVAKPPSPARAGLMAAGVCVGGGENGRVAGENGCLLSRVGARCSVLAFRFLNPSPVHLIRKTYTQHSCWAPGFLFSLSWQRGVISRSPRLFGERVHGSQISAEPERKRHDDPGCPALLAAPHFPTPMPALWSIASLPPHHFVFPSQDNALGQFPCREGAVVSTTICTYNR